MPRARRSARRRRVEPEELAEHVVGVLAETRRRRGARRTACRTCARECRGAAARRPRDAGARRRSHARASARPRRVAVVHRRERGEVRCPAARGDLLRRARARPLGDQRLERVLVGLARRERSRSGPVGGAGDPSARRVAPFVVVAHGDRHPALLAGAAEHAVRRHVRIAVAVARRLRGRSWCGPGRLRRGRRCVVSCCERSMYCPSPGALRGAAARPARRRRRAGRRSDRRRRCRRASAASRDSR